MATKFDDQKVRARRCHSGTIGVHEDQELDEELIGALTPPEVQDVIRTRIAGRGSDYSPSIQTVRRWLSQGFRVDGELVCVEKLRTIGKTHVYDPVAISAWIDKIIDQILSDGRGRHSKQLEAAKKRARKTSKRPSTTKKRTAK